MGRFTGPAVAFLSTLWWLPTSRRPRHISLLPAVVADVTVARAPVELLSPPRRGPSRESAPGTRRARASRRPSPRRAPGGRWGAPPRRGGEAAPGGDARG